MSLRSTSATLALALIGWLAPTQAAFGEDKLAHAQTAHVSHGTQRPKGPPVVRPQWQSGDLVVAITDLSFNCAPAPELSVQADGDVLKLTVLPPTGAVARCWGAHDLTIQVDNVPKELTKVVLFDLKGAELARVALSSP